MNGGRWQYFRTQTRSHNVPMIDSAEQNIYGVSRFVQTDVNRPVSVVKIDLTDVYRLTSCDSLTRTLSMDKEKSL